MDNEPAPTMHGLYRQVVFILVSGLWTGFAVYCLSLVHITDLFPLMLLFEIFVHKTHCVCVCVRVEVILCGSSSLQPRQC